MVEKFFSVKQIDLSPSPSHSTMLLSGPPSCGKTSLLFQFSLNYALKLDSAERSVVFICNRRRLESKPPYLSQGVDPSSDSFRRIQMKYVDDHEGLLKFFAAFHLFDTFPSAVSIDDFGDFFDESCREKYSSARGRDVAMVRILALCCNAIAHANETQSCSLLLSDTHHGDSPRLLFIYKRWIPSIYTIKGGGSGSFLLKKSVTPGNGHPEKMKTAKYSIALQYLVLEGISEDGEPQCC